MRSLFRLFMSVSVFLYRLTGGSFGGRVQGLNVLLLTSKGRKTGRKRTTPLGYFEQNGSYVITASNAGFDSNPAWFYNLKSNPQATIEIGREAMPVTAEIADPELREQLWSRLVALAPGYANYARRTERIIPLVLLRPEQSEGG